MNSKTSTSTTTATTETSMMTTASTQATQKGKFVSFDEALKLVQKANDKITGGVAYTADQNTLFYSFTVEKADLKRETSWFNQIRELTFVKFQFLSQIAIMKEGVPSYITVDRVQIVFTPKRITLRQGDEAVQVIVNSLDPEFEFLDDFIDDFLSDQQCDLDEFEEACANPGTRSHTYEDVQKFNSQLYELISNKKVRAASLLETIRRNYTLVYNGGEKVVDRKIDPLVPTNDKLECFNRMVVRQHIKPLFKESRDRTNQLQRCTLVLNELDKPIVCEHHRKRVARDSCKIIAVNMLYRLRMIDPAINYEHVPFRPSQRQGVISGVANTVGNVAEVASNLGIPGAGLVSSAANVVESLFSGSGKSSKAQSNEDQPTVPKNYPRVHLEHSTQLSLGNDPVEMNTLRLTKSAITPHNGCMPTMNDMTLNDVAKVEGLVSQFVVTDQTAPGALLFASDITPIKGSTLLAPTYDLPERMNPGEGLVSTNNCVFLTPMANVSQHFAFYSGKMKMKLYSGHSMMHSYRIRISFLPDLAAADVDTEILDLIALGSYQHVDVAFEEQFEFETQIPNFSPFHQNRIHYSRNGSMINTTAGTVYNSERVYGYGCYVITALTPLRTTNVTSKSVTVSLMEAAGDDFELAVPTVSKVTPLRKSLQEIRKTVRQADAAGEVQMDAALASDTVVTGARGESQTDASMANTSDVTEYYSGTTFVGDQADDRFVQFAELSLDGMSDSGQVLARYALPEDISRAIVNTPNGMHLKQYAMWRPNLTILVKCNSPPMNAGTVVVATRYYESGFQNDSVNNVESVCQLLQMNHVKINVSMSNDTVIEIPFESYMHMIPTTNATIGSGQYYASLVVGVLNSIELATGSSPPVLTFFAKFSNSHGPTKYYGLRDVYDPFPGTRRGRVIRQGDAPGVAVVDERKEDKQIIDPPTLVSNTNLEKFNGESFALKDVMRRQRVVFEARTQVGKPVAVVHRGEVPTPGGFAVSMLNDTGSVNRSIVCNIPVMFSELKWRSMIGPAAMQSLNDSNLGHYPVSETGESPYTPNSFECLDLVSHMASGFRFGRGSIRYHIQWDSNAPARLTVVHDPQNLTYLDFDQYAVVTNSGTAEEPVLVLSDTYPRLPAVDNYVATIFTDGAARSNFQRNGNAHEIMAWQYNGASNFEVPFYSPARALVNNLTTAELGAYNRTAYHFGNLFLFFDFQKESDDNNVNFRVWRSIGDDADFSVFQGFAPQPVTLGVNQQLSRQDFRDNEMIIKDFPLIPEHPSQNLSQRTIERQADFPDLPCVLATMMESNLLSYNEYVDLKYQVCRRVTKRQMFSNIVNLPGSLRKMCDSMGGAADAISDLIDWAHETLQGIVRTLGGALDNGLGLRMMNVCNSVLTFFGTESLVLRASSFVTCLVNLGVLTANKIGQAVEFIKSRFAPVPEGVIQRQMDSDDDEWAASWASLVLPGIFGFFGLTTSLWKSHPSLITAFKQTISASNSVHTFMRNNFQCLKNTFDYIKNYFFPASYNVEDASEKVKKWVEATVKITAGHMEWQIEQSATLKQKVCVLHEEGRTILLELPKSLSKVRSTLLVLQKKLDMLYDRIGQRMSSGETEREPVSTWLCGAPGIGKSFLTSRFARNLCKYSGVKTGPKFMFTRTKGPYWNGYAGQPVITFDDVGAISSEQSETIFLEDWYGLHTAQPYNIPMADISDKNRVANPYFVFSNSNFLVIKSPLIRDSVAFHRRRDFVIEARFNEEFKKKYPGVECIDNTVDKADIEDGKHLEFRFFKHPETCQVAGPWLPMDIFEPTYYKMAAEQCRFRCEAAIARAKEAQESCTKEDDLEPIDLSALLSKALDDPFLNGAEVEKDHLVMPWRTVCEGGRDLDPKVYPHLGKGKERRTRRQGDDDEPIVAGCSCEETVAIHQCAKPLIANLQKKGTQFTFKRTLILDGERQCYEVMYLPSGEISRYNYFCDCCSVDQCHGYFAGIRKFLEDNYGVEVQDIDLPVVKGDVEVKSWLAQVEDGLKQAKKYLASLPGMPWIFRVVTAFFGCFVTYLTIRTSFMAAEATACYLTGQTSASNVSIISTRQLEASSDTRTRSVRSHKPLRLPGTRQSARQMMFEPEKEDRYLNNMFELSVAGGSVTGVGLKGNCALSVAHPFLYANSWSKDELVVKQTLTLLVDEDFVSNFNYNYCRVAKQHSRRTFLQLKGPNHSQWFRLLPCAIPEGKNVYNVENAKNGLPFKLLPCVKETAEEVFVRVTRVYHGRREMPIDVPFENVEWKRVGDYDLAFIKFPARIPLFKDITSGFISQKTQNQLGPHWSLLSYDFRNDGRHVRDLVRVQFVDFETNDCEFDNIIYESLGWEYDFSGYNGCCGSLLINDTTGLICAMHTSSDGVVGISQIMNQEMWMEFCDPKLIPIDNGLQFSENAAVMKLPEGFEPLGTLRQSDTPHMNTRTQIAPTLLNGLEGLSNLRFPAKLSSGHRPYGYDILAVGVAKQFDATEAFKKEHLDTVVEHYKKRILVYAKPTRSVKQHLTLEEGIRGIDGYEFVDSLKLSTSPGYPYTVTKKCNKRGLIHFNEDGKAVGIDKDVIKDVSDLLAEMKQGHIRGVPFQDFLKDERLKEGKATRLINGSSMAISIIARMYFLEYLAAKRTNRHEIGPMVGMNLHGMEWTRMARDLLKKGDKIICGDYSAFGPTLSPEVVEALADIVNSWYAKYTGDECEESNNVRRCLIYDAIHAHHVAGDVLYQVHQGSPSGAIWTADVNSDVNEIYIRLAWKEIMRGRALEDLAYFDEHVCARTYGDDIIMSVSDKVIGLYNNVSLQNFFRRYGIAYTDVTKTGEMIPYRSLNEAQFLKCSFEKHPKRPGVYLAALEQSVIEEVPQWCRPKNEHSLEELSYAASTEACDLAYSRGEDYHSRIVNLLSKFWEARGRSLQVKGWTTIDRLIFDENRYLDDLEMEVRR